MRERHREGGRYESTVLRAPVPTSQTARAHSTLGQTASTPHSVSPLAATAGGNSQDNVNPCWLLEQIHKAAMQAVTTGLYFLLLLSLVPSFSFLPIEFSLCEILRLSQKTACPQYGCSGGQMHLNSVYLTYYLLNSLPTSLFVT